MAADRTGAVAPQDPTALRLHWWSSERDGIRLWQVMDAGPSSSIHLFICPPPSTVVPQLQQRAGGGVTEMGRDSEGIS